MSAAMTLLCIGDNRTQDFAVVRFIRVTTRLAGRMGIESELCFFTLFSQAALKQAHRITIERGVDLQRFENCGYRLKRINPHILEDLLNEEAEESDICANVKDTSSILKC